MRAHRNNNSESISTHCEIVRNGGGLYAKVKSEATMSKSIENKVLLYGTRNAKKTTTLVASVFSCVYSCIFHLISIACHSLRDRKRSQNETNIAFSSNKICLFARILKQIFYIITYAKYKISPNLFKSLISIIQLRFSKIFAQFLVNLIMKDVFREIVRLKRIKCNNITIVAQKKCT